MAEFAAIFNTTMTYIKPVFEILVITLVIYSVLYFLRGTRGLYILSGIISTLILLTFIAGYFEFGVIKWLLSSLWTMFATAIIVIFQPELRRAFAQLGSTPFAHRKTKKKEAINEVVSAVINMSKQRIGALIVFEREIGMRMIENNSVKLDGRLNSHLIESIFYPNSPLHDGAIIIRGDKIIAAHAILPLSQDESLIRTLGTRHRASIGITEETDAVSVVVSEETGSISIACRGRLKHNIGSDKLARYLNTLLISSSQDTFRSIFGTMTENDEITAGFTGNKK